MGKQNQHRSLDQTNPQAFEIPENANTFPSAAGITRQNRPPDGR